MIMDSDLNEIPLSRLEELERRSVLSNSVFQDHLAHEINDISHSFNIPPNKYVCFNEMTQKILFLGGYRFGTVGDG